MAKKSKSFMHSFNMELLSKERLSGSDLGRLTAALYKLIKKNKDLLGENIEIVGYDIDNGRPVKVLWEEMERNRSILSLENSLQQRADYMEWLNESHFEKNLPEKAKKYAKNMAKYTSNDDEELVVEDKLEALIDRLPGIIQSDKLLFNLQYISEDFRYIEVVDHSGDMYVRLGLLEW